MRDTVISGAYTYVADYTGSLLVVEVSIPASPSLTGSYATGFTYQVLLNGGYAYLANGWNEQST